VYTIDEERKDKPKLEKDHIEKELNAIDQKEPKGGCYC